VQGCGRVASNPTPVTVITPPPSDTVNSPEPLTLTEVARKAVARTLPYMRRESSIVPLWLTCSSSHKRAQLVMTDISAIKYI
jgi:hypothetical protein